MGGLIFSIPVFYGTLLTLSLFNTVVLLWLGLTVLLNAAVRTRAIWLAGGGLVAAALFFASHTIIVAQSAAVVSSSLDMWWLLGWVGLIVAPVAWYLAMLWHAGYWGSGTSDLRRRHRRLLLIAVLLAVALLGVLTVAEPIPSTMRLSGLYFFTTPTVFGLPVLVLLYPPFVLACLVFSLSALLRPGPPAHPVVAPARERARPWLIAASIAALVVTILMFDAMFFLIVYGRGHYLEVLLDQPVIEAFWMDLVISLPSTVAAILLGQAVVAYEIFAGTTLPRRGLHRQWHMVLLFATGYSLAVGVGLALASNPIYTVLLASVFVAITYALIAWRAQAERRWHVARLRPFVGGGRVLDTLLDPSGAYPREIGSFFAPLCRDVLGAQCAYLLPTGVLASLVGGPLAYPAGASIDFGLDEVLPQCTGPETVAIPVSVERYGGARWAVSLWSSRGLAGVFFLGDKSDGGLYSQEEVEVARSSGERLLDSIALANLAHRLMDLQRRRFVEAQVLDQQSRRALHDEILPTLHAALLRLSRGAGEISETPEALEQLGDVHRRLSALLREMPVGHASRVEELGLISALQDMVRTEFGRDFADVSWQVSPEAQSRADALPTLTAEVVFYAAKELIRNAARHGRGENPDRPLHLGVEAVYADGLNVRISDDGVGLAMSPASQPAGGQGLALHSTMLAVVGGFLATESRPRSGTTVILWLPAELWLES